MCNPAELNLIDRDTDHTIFGQYKETGISFNYSEDRDESVISSPPPLKKSVTFDSVSVREYDIILGDHPCVSRGAPISIGWNYFSTRSMDLDEYEVERFSKRSMFFKRKDNRHMVVSHFQRRTILRLIGYSDEDIDNAASEAKRAKVKRKSSLRFMWLSESSLFLHQKIRTLQKLIGS